MKYLKQLGREIGENLSGILLVGVVLYLFSRMFSFLAGPQDCKEYTTGEYINNETPIRCQEIANQVKKDYFDGR